MAYKPSCEKCKKDTKKKRELISYLEGKKIEMELTPLEVSHLNHIGFHNYYSNIHQIEQALYSCAYTYCVCLRIVYIYICTYGPILSSNSCSLTLKLQLKSDSVSIPQGKWSEP